MKTKIISMAIIVALLTTSLCGCVNDSPSITDNKTDNPTMLISELPDNIESLTETLNKCPNLTVSDNFEVNLPDNVTNIYEYTSQTPSNVDMKQYYDDYMDIFKYLFPKHNLDDNYLYYMGGSSDAQNFNKVSDWYEKIISGDEGRVNFLYDETWLRDMTEWKSPVCLELGNPIGCGYAVINKGKTVELTDCKVYDDALGAERYVLLESYDPSEWLEYVGTYSPDSTESFMLSDGETPINQAVDFFENYIYEMPSSDNKNTETVVFEVEVYKVNENVYGYYFLTAKKYQGICFDYMRSGTVHSKFDDYSTTGGNAFMIESDDVDVLYGYYQLQYCSDLKSYEKIVTPEAIAKIISNKLTDGVVFEVKSAELVYTEKPKKTSEGFIDVENPSSEVSPAWKFKLYNSNDKYFYICYVDAVDGDNFRYYTTPSASE